MGGETEVGFTKLKRYDLLDDLYDWVEDEELEKILSREAAEEDAKKSETEEE